MGGVFGFLVVGCVVLGFVFGFGLGFVLGFVLVGLFVLFVVWVVLVWVLCGGGGGVVFVV